MCGICGIFGREDKILVRQMLSTIKHRGPDDEGVYADTNISLGHCRLSIIDLSSKGRQPMSNEDGNIWLSVNGEIYNFQVLRHDLEERGHDFHSNSDSEVIIHAYEEYGIEFVQKLRGMFAFALYDGRVPRLILARDPIGKKPLYYCFGQEGLTFASEIKAILASGVEREVDLAAVCAYLAFQYSLGAQTLFKNIKKVPPGYLLICDKQGLEAHKYWDLQERCTDASLGEATTKLRNLLEEATDLRMIADVPIGAFLSGGIDSSSVVALARRARPQGEFHTFSVGFETFSELRYANLVSEHLETTQHDLIITDELVLRNIDRIAWHYDEPLGDAAIINVFLLAKEARKYVKVVLAGEGGDELFGGYDPHTTARQLALYYQLPRIIRGGVIKPLILFPFKETRYLKRDSKIRTANKIANALTEETFDAAYFQRVKNMSDGEISYLTTLTCNQIRGSAFRNPVMVEPLNETLAFDCKNLLPEKFLMKADKATMSHALEERLPLLDKYVIEYAFSIPPRFKLQKGQRKYVLRKAVDDLLPASIVNREKEAFGTPLASWLAGELKDFVLEKIVNGSLLQAILWPDKLKTLIEEFERDPTRNNAIVWTLFALELWYDTYFNA
jgi:asparagine synthase (glutamine-hydrolysing)